MKILLVDDDSDDQLLFQEVIHEIDSSMVCETANDGDEALLKLRQSSAKPDLIFLDVNMPRMDGRTCLRYIRESPDLSHLNVVIVSTFISRSDEELFLLHNASYIEKPNEYEKLVAELKKYITLAKNSEPK
jgi:CheY-like chemotaxis protein